MPDTTQDGRPVNIVTPLGKDVLLLENFDGREEISRPFEFHLNLLSENSAIDLNGLLRKSVTIHIQLFDGSWRPINGLVRSVRQGLRDRYFTRYYMDIVPWFWFLKLRRDCHIFQNKTVPDIIQEIFSAAGYTDYALKLTGTYQPREYCVQYRETDYNFVSRLMEEEGIFYYFAQSDGQHTMTLCDNVGDLQPCPNQSSVRFAVQETILEEDFVHDLNVGAYAGTGKYTVNDYYFVQPSLDLKADESDAERDEIYDYPGKYIAKAEGERYAKLRLEADEALRKVLDGRSTCRSFLPGYKFDLVEHYRGDTNQSYLILGVTHHMGGNSYYSEGDTWSYENRFQVMPSSTVFRPQRVTPKPFIRSTQTAIVTGPSGEEIYVDKYGRVKVHFYWHRYDQKDENSSCWIRVAEGWAGKNWGIIFNPRIGQEVVVNFLEGDPDQPLITGRVYNGELNVPYTLPDRMTESGILTRSTKNGSTKNYNEIRFEDKKGSELFTIHAEKDMDESIENDRALTVDHDQLEWVKNNKHSTVDSSRATKIGGSDSLTVGGSSDNKIGQKFAVDSGQEIHLKGGMKVIIEAGMQLSLKGPGGFVDIGPSGVTIQGTMVLINSGGAAGSGSGASPQTPTKPDSAEDKDK